MKTLLFTTIALLTITMMGANSIQKHMEEAAAASIDSKGHTCYRDICN